MRLARWASALVLVLSLTAPRPARGDDPPRDKLPLRSATFAWEKTLLRVSLPFRDAFTPQLAAKLSSGLPTVVALRAYVLREGNDEPVALAARSCHIVYDLWDEVYRVKITLPGGERNLAVLNVEGVFRQCAEVREFPVVDRAVLKAKTPYFLGIIVDVNPVSPQMLEQMRRWVARPMGSTNIGPSDALFGSFVALFVRQIGTSDRTVRFRTQAFAAP